MTVKTEQKPPDLLEFRSETVIKIQQLYNELTKTTLYGATVADIDSLREMASLLEDISYEMSPKTLGDQDRELYSTMGDLYKAIERIWHGLDDIPDLTRQILEGLKRHCPAVSSYCYTYDDIPSVGELVIICGHFSAFNGGIDVGAVEGRFVFQRGGEVTVSFPAKKDWKSYISVREGKGDIVLEGLEVVEHYSGKMLIWRAGKSAVFGRAPE